jgi:hypothetical protein
VASLVTPISSVKDESLDDFASIDAPRSNLPGAYHSTPKQAQKSRAFPPADALATLILRPDVARVDLPCKILHTTWQMIQRYLIVVSLRKSVIHLHLCPFSKPGRMRCRTTLKLGHISYIMQDGGEEQVLTGGIDRCRRLPRVGRKVSVRNVATGNETWRVRVGEVATAEILVFSNYDKTRKVD